MKTLCFGSLNIDYVYSVEHITRPGETLSASGRRVFSGGKGLNQAIALARAGSCSYMAGMIGRDGAFLLDELNKSGVDTSFVRITDESSGHAVIQVDKSAQNSILIYGGANVCVTEEFIDYVLGHFDKNDIILLQNEINNIPYILKKARSLGLKTVFNPSPVNDMLFSYPLELVDLFIVNEIEGYELSGEKEPDKILSSMAEKYPRADVLLTLGGNGSVYRDGNGIYRQDIYKVKAIDTTAAGDTFSGYFLSALSLGEAPEAALKYASKASSIAVSRSGASPSIPTRSEVLAFNPE